MQRAGQRLGLLVLPQLLLQRLELKVPVKGVQPGALRHAVCDTSRQVTQTVGLTRHSVPSVSTLSIITVTGV